MTFSGRVIRPSGVTNEDKLFDFPHSFGPENRTVLTEISF
jgi:hypothetical protein